MDELNELEMYEKKCEEIRRTNDSLLELFEKDMEGLSPKTIRRHLSNVDFISMSFFSMQMRFRWNMVWGK